VTADADERDFHFRDLFVKVVFAKGLFWINISFRYEKIRNNVTINYNYYCTINATIYGSTANVVS
jgi:hypothetical protein